MVSLWATVQWFATAFHTDTEELCVLYQREILVIQLSSSQQQYRHLQKYNPDKKWIVEKAENILSEKNQFEQ